jgi:hypothetical protein
METFGDLSYTGLQLARGTDQDQTKRYQYEKCLFYILWDHEHVLVYIAYVL